MKEIEPIIKQLQQPKGWIILNKEPGFSSFYPIKKIKNALKIPKMKIGHAGTLDPFAGGILPIAVGEATKLIPFITNKTKEYKFLLKFGIETDTLDIEGTVIKQSDVKIKAQDIEKILEAFKGKVIQTPPLYSAVKIQGKRAYELARNNIEFTIKEREVEIYELNLISFDYEKQIAEIYVKCGSGTYIRSLGRDIARKLESVGYLISLDRISVGIFNKDDAILLDNILDIVHNGKINDYLKPIDIVLDDILAIDLSEDETRKVKNGLSVYLNNYSSNKQQIRTYCNNQLVSIGEVQNNYYKPNRVFKY